MRRETIKTVTAITLLLIAMFGGLSMIVWAYADANRVWEFWSGPAAGWVQAIGSIVAIVASFKLGQQSFKNQLQRDKIAALERKLHAYMLLQQVFIYAGGVDKTASEKVTIPGIWAAIGMAAKDVLAVMDNVQMMDIPDADLLKRLIRSRETITAYMGMASTANVDSVLTPGSSWMSYVNECQMHNRQSELICALEASKIQKLIEQVQH